jgi:hypothetical protein
VFLDGRATIHDKIFDCRSNDGQPIREVDFSTPFYRGSFEPSTQRRPRRKDGLVGWISKAIER